MPDTVAEQLTRMPVDAAVPGRTVAIDKLGQPIGALVADSKETLRRTC